MALVLIVDDDTMIVEMLAEMVRDYGHTAITAANGAQALAQARAQPPALIISDVMMPVMDGYALLRAVRDTPELHHTPIFLMSAAFSSQHSPSFELSPDGYLAKPFRLMIIEGLLERLPHSEAGC